MQQTTKQQTQTRPSGGSKSREAQILTWAQRLMKTKGYGWSKAISEARDLYGEE